MYLSALRVRNFRNLKDIALNFRPGLNVLVGENNIGKTNLLDAIRVALGPASGGDFIRLEETDLYHDELGQSPASSFQVDLEFRELSETQQGQFLDLLNYDGEHPHSSTATLHFEWRWLPGRRRGFTRRWGSDREQSETAVPEDVLQALPLTMLEALRDAQRLLAPGRQSRLGRLLRSMANDGDRMQVTAILAQANTELQKEDLVTRAQARILQGLEGASGPKLSQGAAIRTSELSFESIVAGLRLVIRSRLFAETGTNQEEEIALNGLGYNNLLFIATVLAELEQSASDDTTPILLVEEPEAHLHPQLQTLLADYLSTISKNRKVQVIVTTHSPSVASHVDPKNILVIHRSNAGPSSPNLAAVALEACGFNDREAGQLRRMLDVTRATMLFARGVILVEGVSEALLLPVFARLLGRPLESFGVSVVQVAGLDFRTIAKLFGENKLTFPVAIVTDGDPAISTEPLEAPSPRWQYELPLLVDGRVQPSSRVIKLFDAFVNNAYVKVFNSEVTFEYDLASAGETNPLLMGAAWEKCFVQQPPLNEDMLIPLLHADRVLQVWRHVCRSESSRGKPELAQALADILETGDSNFVIPSYLVQAISYATQSQG